MKTITRNNPYRQASKKKTALLKLRKKAVELGKREKAKHNGNRAQRREGLQPKKAKTPLKKLRFGNRVFCMEGCGRMVLDEGKRTCQKCQRRNEVRVLRREVRR